MDSGPSSQPARRSTSCSLFTLSLCAIAHTAYAFSPAVPLAGRGSTTRIPTSAASLRGARLWGPSLASTGRGQAAATQLPLRMALMDEEKDDGSPRNGGLDNVIKDFVTQRSLQTHLRNLEVSHDGCKLEFLETFLNHTGITDFHGYGALRVGWKVYLQTLRKAAPFDVIQRKKLRRGGSPNNPYIKDEYMEWEVHVNPIEIADDLFDIRKQIAAEWQEDLQLISAENSELFRHHKEMILNEEDTHLYHQHPLIQCTDNDSPLRKANYDLLEKYATHVATERVIFDLSRSRSQEHVHDWLATYMLKKGQRFHGDSGRNVGREFLANMLNAPPSFVRDKTSDNEDDVLIVDPMDIAAKIMVERQCVAERWILALEEIEEDHLKLHRQHMQDCLNLEVFFEL